MFYESPVFLRFRGYGRRVIDATAGRGWWLVMAPGIALTLLALAILIWPELLAYLVAAALLAAGITLMAWGWRLRRLERNLRRHNGTPYGSAVYYEERTGPWIN